MGKKFFLIVFLISIGILSGCATNREHSSDSNLKKIGDNINITTSLGEIQGKVVAEKSNSAPLVASYKGIPYAKFASRFHQSTLRKDNFSTLEASHYGPACYQHVPNRKVLANEYDCLTLNIWTPNNDKHKDLMPVYVWIHGGANVMGSSSEYDFTQLAKEGIIVVSLNYRVNIHGFAAFDDENNHRIENAAMSDLVNGLKWVNKYIRDFGGDPDSITIGGQSAGAYNVSYLLASPKAKGLFQRAIMESGGDLGWSHERAEQVSMDFAEKFTKKANLTSGEALAELTQANPYDIAEASSNLVPDQKKFWVQDDYAVDDGDFLPTDPYKAIKQGNINRVPVLLGMNSDEYTMYMNMIDTDLFLFDAMIESYVGSEYISDFRTYYHLNEQSSKEDIASAIKNFGNVAFLYDSYLFADTESNLGMKTYVYSFEYGHENNSTVHGSEMPLVYKTIPDKDNNPEKEQLSANMFHYWTQFIKYGDPNGISHDDSILTWPEYTPHGNKNIMVFDKTLKTESIYDDKNIGILQFILKTKYGYEF